MAAREHQGYQVALVIFVMLTVLLSITTFMFFKKFREEQQKSAELAQSRDAAVAERNERDNQVNSLKPLLGYSPETTLDTIQKDVTADHAIYAPYRTSGAAAPAAPADEFAESGETATVTEISNPLDYRELAKQLKAELDKRSAELVQLTADKQQLEATIAANRTEDAGKLAAATAGQTAAQTELAGERQKFNDDRAKSTEQLAQLTQALDKKQNDMTALDTELNNKIKDLIARDAARNKQYVEMKDRVTSLTPRNFETTDGMITAVLPRERLVYINLGSSDGLRPAVTFSVYGQDSARLVESESKAEIEVTQITGAHSATARVLTDSRSDPILPGDAIFSPAFHPGSKVRFAIVGVTDIDGDGDSDRQRIRDLIATNRGIIDCEVDDDGKTTGQVTPATQYLIQGKAPSDNKVLTEYSRVIGVAKESGTVVLSVQQFLNMVGYKADERTVGLGRGADPRDFPPKKSSSAYDKPLSPQFRERRPPAAPQRAVEE